MAERTKAFYKNKLRICGEKLIQAETEYDTYLNQTDAIISQQLGVANEYEVELMIARLQSGLSEMEKTVKQKQGRGVFRTCLPIENGQAIDLHSAIRHRVAHRFLLLTKRCCRYRCHPFIFEILSQNF